MSDHIDYIKYTGYEEYFNNSIVVLLGSQKIFSG